MKMRQCFTTPDEAAAFVAGVEFVNDSALHAMQDANNTCDVIINDEDNTEDMDTCHHGCSMYSPLTGACHRECEA